MEFFDLQLFADDEQNSGGLAVDTNSGEPTENKEEPKAEPKYTDDDVNDLLKGKKARWRAEWERELKEQREIEKQQIAEAERLAKMTAEEKTAEKLASLEKKIQYYEHKDARDAMAKQARAMLSDKNVHVSDELLSNLIADDADSTKASVESFLSVFEAAVEKRVKEALKGAAPKAGGSNGGLTREQIMKVTNRNERQRLINENLHLFK